MIFSDNKLKIEKENARIADNFLHSKSKWVGLTNIHLLDHIDRFANYKKYIIYEMNTEDFVKIYKSSKNLDNVSISNQNIFQAKIPPKISYLHLDLCCHIYTAIEQNMFGFFLNLLQDRKFKKKFIVDITFCSRCNQHEYVDKNRLIDAIISIFKPEKLNIERYRGGESGNGSPMINIFMACRRMK